MTRNRKLFLTYKAYNEGNVVVGSNLRGNIIGKGPSAVRSYEGNLYTLVIVDDYSRTYHDREFYNEVQFEEFCNAYDNNIEDETLEVDEVVNIKESKNHPLEPKNVNEALKDESLIIAIQEELNQFVANDVWKLVPQPKSTTIIGTKWVYRNKLDENSVVSRN
ncbi:hypothetical protein Tco_1121235 [Tanacetum coccineum]|uniref:Reverse transcriptase Ty1/copia-type domain-containing protein n=1 Tax=Tanacetum coccineum TaxID=301880 RepID=A0ABQ5IYM9_9ASTR